jgi:hypothetical protein
MVPSKADNVVPCKGTVLLIHYQVTAILGAEKADKLMLWLPSFAIRRQRLTELPFRHMVAMRGFGIVRRSYGMYCIHAMH